MKIEENKKPLQRRDFFGALLAKIVEPIAGVVEQKVSRFEELASKAASEPSFQGPAPLRPPGMIGEDYFLKMCQRSGECIKVCPVQAIKPLSHPDPRLRMTPHLVPDTTACILCEDVPCVSACPSGALMPVAREKIRIGLAVVHYDLCLRADGEDCRECLTQCPLGEKAIHLDEQEMIEILPEGCTGCGLCAVACPSAMRAIAVIPRN